MPFYNLFKWPSKKLIKVNESMPHSYSNEYINQLKVELLNNLKS